MITQDNIRKAQQLLDELDDILDILDEEGGNPADVNNAYDVLWDYFMELRSLNQRYER
jgi:hypothetical protein